MNTKREQNIFFRRLLLLVLLFGSFFAKAQEVNVDIVDEPAKEDGLVTATLRVTISNPNIRIAPTNILYMLAGSSTEGDDFEVIGTIEIPLGQNNVEFDITPIQDNFVEGDEDLNFSILPSPEYTLGANSDVTILIEDDDVGVVSFDKRPIVFIDQLNEGDENGTFRLVCFDASGTNLMLNGLGETVEIFFEVLGSGTATGPGTAPSDDYDLFNGNPLDLTYNETNMSFLYAVETASRRIRVRAFNDALIEGNETITLRLISTSNSLYTIDPANDTATVTIIDRVCDAGIIAPVLNANSTQFCDAFSVSLDTYLDTGVADNPPTNAELIFSTNADPSVQADWVPAAGGSEVSQAGTYFAFFANTANDCFSPTNQLTLTQNTAPNPGTPIDNIPDACNNADANFTPRLLDLDDLIIDEDAGDWLQTAGLSLGAIPNNNRINFDNVPADLYEFTYTTTGAVGACTNQSTVIEINVIDCDPCLAGSIAPPLNTAVATDRCDELSVNLNTFITGEAASAPAGTTLRWSAIANPLVSGDLIAATRTVSGTYYGVFWDSFNTCASPSTQVDLLLSESPTAGINANGSACNNATTAFGATSLDLDTLLSAGVDPGTWVSTSGPEAVEPDANSIVQFQNRAAGTYVYTYTTNNAVFPCTNGSAIFSITVDDCDPCVAGNIAPVLDPDTATIVCDEFTASFNDYTNSIAPVGTILTWSTDSDGENLAAHLSAEEASNPPSAGGTYYGFFYDAINACTSPNLQIDIVLNTTPVLSDVTGSELCITETTGRVILSATASNNATINWYASATGGESIDAGPSFTTPAISVTTTYYAEATLNGCASERQAAIAIIQQQPLAGIPQNGGNSSSCSDANNGPTIVDLDDLILGEDAGMWVYTNGPSPDIAIPSNNIINFVGSPEGDYTFTFTTTGAQAPCSNESTVIRIFVNDCDIDTDLDGLLDGIEAVLGTDPNDSDTDGDGILDGVEVGNDFDNPLDSDLDSAGGASPDGIIDALDSNILDFDNDGVVDQLDPGDEDPCIPTRQNGVCDFDLDDVPDADDPEPDNPCFPNINHPNCNPDPIDLEITKEFGTISDPSVPFGSEVTFTVTLRNLSAVKVRNIQIGELLETGFEYVFHEASVGEYDAISGEWNIVEIEAASTHTLMVTVTILDAGTYGNTAELLASFPEDNNPANDSATVILPIELPVGVNLILEKTVSLGVGKERLKTVTGLVNGVTSEVEVIYYLKVINKSFQDIVSSIRVSDIFTNDDTVEFEIIDAETPAETSFNQATGVWVINRTLAIDEEIELSYRVAFRGQGVILNTATIEGSVPRESMVQDADSNSTARVEITTANEVGIGILYNQFSPNNDGLNDDLKINFTGRNEQGEDFEIINRIYNIQIFNRYGNLVFEGLNLNTEVVWDGSWKGKDAPDGTYFYTLNIDFGEGLEIQKGWIQLIR